MNNGYKFWAIIFCALWGLVIAYGQENKPTRNPFEIKDRIVQKPDSLSSYDKISSDSASEDTSSVVDTSYTSNGNPFEVNHVPIRKSTLTPANPITELTQIKPRISNQFIFGILIFSWALLAIVISAKTSLLGYLLKSVMNLNMMKYTKREESNNTFLLSLLYLVFIINFSVFIFLVQRYFNGSGEAKFWGYIFLGVSFIYLVRHIGMWLLGAVFPIEKDTSFFSYVILVFNILFGICIIPINLLLVYGPPNLSKISIYTGLAFFLLFYLLRYLRGISASLFLIGKGLLLFFIYLCTFEIAPILIIVRAVLNFSGK
jgi:hypothetical protein